MNYGLKSPLLVHLEVTYSCNKRCIHCYNYWRDEKTELSVKCSLDKESLENSIKQIIDNDVFHVVITGGEPLIVFDELLPYLEIIRKHNITISLNTNMMLFTQEIADKLMKLKINNLLVSFPSCNENTDYKITNNKLSFSKTIEGIKIAKRNGFVVTTNMVVSRLNYEEIFNTAKLAKELGVDKFSINMAVPPDNSNSFEDLQITRKQLISLPYIMKDIKEKPKIKVGSVEAYSHCFISDEDVLEESGFNRGCSAGKTFCVISPEGDIRPCIVLSDTYGKDLKEAWRKMKFYRDGSLIPKKCHGCKRLSRCNGGCKAQIKHNNNICDPYMNEKNKSIFKEQKEISLFDLNDKIELIFPASLRHRSEEFGGILFSSTNSFVTVDSQLFQYITSRIGKTVQFNEFYINNKYKKEDAIKTVSYLIHKKIIKINWKEIEQWIIAK